MLLPSLEPLTHREIQRKSRRAARARAGVERNARGAVIIPTSDSPSEDDSKEAQVVGEEAEHLRRLLVDILGRYIAQATLKRRQRGSTQELLYASTTSAKRRCVTKDCGHCERTFTLLTHRHE